MTELATLEKQGHVGAITLNNPPVNALAHSLRSALCDVFSAALADEDVQAILLLCAGRTFIAGADITELDRIPKRPDVPEIVELIGSSPKPVTAALFGTALGGGFELALACDFRVAAPGTKVGFPEVGLGILPGAGGTQRLPRLIGVRQALDMIVGGAPVAASEALAMGLIDEIVEGDLAAGSMAFVERTLAEARPRPKLSGRRAVPESAGLFEEYEKAIAGKSRGLIAPFHCIQAIRAAVELPFADGLERERQLFAELVASSQSKAQRHAFFGEREVARTPRIPKDTRAGDVRAVAVVGANETGAGMAKGLADRRLAVTFVGTTDVELGATLLRESYQRAVLAGALTQTQADQRIEGIRRAVGLDALEGADLVVSALPVALSKEVLAGLEARDVGDTLFALGASVDIDAVASTSKRPERVLGLRFSGSDDSSKLLEVLCASRTGVESCATAMKLGRALGKVAVLENTSCDSAGERLSQAYIDEALFLLEEGALPDHVDRVLYDFGFAKGPFETLDAEGVDVAWARSKATLGRAGARSQACDILDQLCERKRFGRALGVGFHRYDQAGSASPDPTVQEMLVRHSSRRGIVRRAIADAEILERAVFALVAEGAALLDEGVLTRAIEVDMVCIHGYGFPVYRGGPMFFADQLGVRELCGRIARYQEQAQVEPHPRAPLLGRLVGKSEGFYR